MLNTFSGLIDPFLMENKIKEIKIPVSGELTVNGITIPYTVAYNAKRKNNTVCYYREGRLEIQVKPSTTSEEIARLIIEHEEWIFRQILTYDSRYRKQDEADLIFIGNEKIPVRITYSTRAKRMTIKVHPLKPVTVVAPYNTESERVREFLHSNRTWIAKQYGSNHHESHDKDEFGFLEAGGDKIKYHIQRSNRARRIILKIKPDKSVVLVLPLGVDQEIAHEFVKERSAWILEKLSINSNPVPKVRQYLDGDFLPVLGREHKLTTIVDAPTSDFIIKDNGIVAYLPKDLNKISRPMAIRNMFEIFLQKTLDEVSRDMVKTWAAHLGVPVPIIRYRNQKTRWGVCTPNGIILNIRLAMAPVEIIEYVIVHELCHIRQHNHSAKFWEVVELMLPDYKVRLKRLKQEGAFYNL